MEIKRNHGGDPRQKAENYPHFRFLLFFSRHGRFFIKRKLKTHGMRLQYLRFQAQIGKILQADGLVLLSGIKLIIQALHRAGKTHSVVFLPLHGSPVQPGLLPFQQDSMFRLCRIFFFVSPNHFLTPLWLFSEKFFKTVCAVNAQIRTTGILLFPRLTEIGFTLIIKDPLR